MLARLAVDGKSNEITAVPKLLEKLSLAGTIVTVDALDCQRAIARDIVDQGGDYALAPKSLRPRRRVATRQPFTSMSASSSTIPSSSRTAAIRQPTPITGVGRDGASDIAWFTQTHAWPGLSAIGKIT